MPRPAVRFVAFLAAALVTPGCERVEQAQDRFRDLTPHEAYLASLSAAGLAQTALVRDWVAVSLRAVERAPLVQLPFQEEGFIAADEAVAMAYRLRVGRGQRLMGRITLGEDPNARVFVDLFRVPEEPRDPLRPVLSVDTVPGEFSYEPWREGEYILRVQPELLRGGRYRVALRLEAQLAFPVEGHGMEHIQSVFGVPRDGGRRVHHGVDIFARRGTPVVAAAAGTVSRVQVTNLGGKVVWVRDPVRNANLYFAHLDSQTVRPDQHVAVGDTLGFVGNTGNARTTPPHLHFGLYRRGEGPVDPAPFLRRPRGVLAPLHADLGRLGGWVNPVNEGVYVRSAPDRRSAVVAELARVESMRVWAGSGDWYRVRLAGGSEGYVLARLTQASDPPEYVRSALGIGGALVAPAEAVAHH